MMPSNMQEGGAGAMTKWEMQVGSPLGAGQNSSRSSFTINGMKPLHL